LPPPVIFALSSVGKEKVKLVLMKTNALFAESMPVS
jgi:hypothetical protein